MKGSLLCTDCTRLEREYQLTIVEIYSVVGRRFKTVGEKLHELVRWQDLRDKAVKVFYQATVLVGIEEVDRRRNVYYRWERSPC